MIGRGLAALAVLILSATAASGQQTRIRDLTIFSGDIPVRLVGYGLVVGLNGTGDRVIGVISGGQTVRSVANLLRNFGVEVPENMLRTRNVAAVLVTAELSPYLRPGGRFDVHVASIGDAVSLRGGVLWNTPLLWSPAEPAFATAQGAILVGESFSTVAGGAFTVETTATLPDGGLLEVLLPPPDFNDARLLYLRRPDLGTARRIAEAINTALGASTAVATDPGLVALQLAEDPTTNHGEILEQIGLLTVEPERAAVVIIDSRSGTVAAGGDITLGTGTVSVGGLTLSIGGAPGVPGVPGAVPFEQGATIQDVAAALHAVATPPQVIAQIFDALRIAGSLTAQMTIR